MGRYSLWSGCFRLPGRRALRTDPLDLVRISQPFSSQELGGYLRLNMKLCLSPGFEPGPSDRKAYCETTRRMGPFAQWSNMYPTFAPLRQYRWEQFLLDEPTFAPLRQYRWEQFLLDEPPTGILPAIGGPRVKCRSGGSSRRNCSQRSGGNAVAGILEHAVHEMDESMGVVCGSWWNHDPCCKTDHRFRTSFSVVFLADNADVLIKQETHVMTEKKRCSYDLDVSVILSCILRLPLCANIAGNNFSWMNLQTGILPDDWEHVVERSCGRSSWRKTLVIVVAMLRCADVLINSFPS